MVEQGPTDDVIFNPQHEYTQRLLSDVPRLHEGADALVSDDGPGAHAVSTASSGGAHAI
jgi:peptide/nickel transport system ATP-binding protein